MAAEPSNSCLACGAVIPDGTDRCTGCGTQLVFCFQDDCCKPYPSEEKFCPFCGTANELWEELRAAKAPASAPPPVAAKPDLQQAFQAAFGAPTEQTALSPRELALPAVKVAKLPKPPAPQALVPAAPAPPGPPAAPTFPVAGATLPGLNLAAEMPGWDAVLPTGLEPVGDAAPVLIEMLAGGPHRCGQKSMVRLRARGRSVSKDAQLEMRAVSELFDTPVQQRIALGPGQTHELTALKFVPRVAGSDEIQLALTLTTGAGLPLGRWSAQIVVPIEESPADAASRIQAGGDVFVFGSGPNPFTADQLAGLTGLPGPAATWQALTLQPDWTFNRRVTGTCPAFPSDTPRLPAEGQAWPAAMPLYAVIHLTEAGTATSRAIAVAIGTAAGLGRGGDPGVAWWLKPEPYDARQHGRLSRQHTRIELREGRAWAVDVSTNGTLLNGTALTRGQAELLADGDRLEPAQVVPLRVRLFADGKTVHAIALERGDALGSRLSYLLTDGSRAVPLGPKKWAAWRRGPNAAPLLALTTGSVWNTLAANQPGSLTGRDQLTWHLHAVPAEQERYLAPAPAP